MSLNPTAARTESRRMSNRLTGNPTDHIPTLERALSRLQYAARLKPSWSTTMPRDEARALLNEIARLKPSWSTTMPRDEARALLNEIARLKKPDRGSVGGL